ncbi:MAG TPA: hypothetical protein VF859_06950 [Burkholderiales bacterium]
MDPAAFEEVIRELEPAACPFAPALLSGCAGCSLAERHRVAEGERVTCPAPAHRDRCLQLRARLREHSGFALGLPDPEARLPHAKALRMLCGGLEGLAKTLERGTGDVRGLVELLLAQHPGFEGLPWAAVMRTVSALPGRGRR